MQEAYAKYDSIYEMINSMPCELELRIPRSRTHPCIVFQSKNHDELHHQLADSSITINRMAPEVIDEDISQFFSWWLNHYYMANYLAQIWAPVTIGDKQYLTTSDQLFGMRELVKGLCSYRKHCLDFLILMDDDLSTEGGLVGPPGRVFRTGMPEACLEVSHYTSKEYPLRDKAVACGIRGYLALPLSKSPQCKRKSVLELVINEYTPGLLGAFKRIFGNLEFTVECPRPENFGMNDMLRAVCKTHQLPLAQTWVSLPYSSSYKNEAVRNDGRSSYILNDDTDSDDEGEDSCTVDYVLIDDLIRFREASYYIKKGRGVVGKAFSSKGACFCKDITQLSIDEYSLVPNARKAGLTGCFAISLTHRDRWEYYCFIVEFFLPHKKTESGDPRTLIKMVLTTMKEHLKDFRVASGQELGEKLFVEVIKASPTDELDSFEICNFAGIGGAERAMDHETGANVPPDSNNLNQHEGEVVLLLDGRSHAENVNNAGPHNVRKEQYDNYRVEEIVQPEDSNDNVDNLNVHGAEQNVVQLDDPIDNVENLNVNGAEQNAFRVNPRHMTNSSNSKNQRGIKRINREYGITLADLLQHSGKKLEEVADHFGVSRSTFKRICRAHQIFRWPPRKAKHDDGPSDITRVFVQPAEEELQLPVHLVQQDLNSKPDSTQDATSTVQNDCIMVVKVTYREDTIRFNLSVSSGKTALEEEIAKRFPLSIGSFNVRYLDEDGEWILVGCDADLETCKSIMRSSGKNTVKMSVQLPQDRN